MRISHVLQRGLASLLLLLGLSAGTARAQGALDGHWDINLDGQLGRLYLQQHSSGSLFGSIWMNGQPGEPVYGFYADAERRFVLMRGSYTEPAQTLLGEWQPPAVWRGYTLLSARLSGLAHGLQTKGGAQPARNTFAFAAVPQGEIIRRPPPVPVSQPGATCLRDHHVFYNRPAEYGLGWTANLRFDVPATGCATGEVTGWFDGDRIRGYYAPAAGLLVFQRVFTSVNYRPNQVYVGRPQGGELVVGGLCGDFYAIDGYGGASPWRLRYDWTTDYWSYGSPTGVTGCPSAAGPGG